MLSWGMRQDLGFFSACLVGDGEGTRPLAGFSPLTGEPVQGFWLKMGPSLSTGLSPSPPPPIFRLSLGHLQ